MRKLLKGRSASSLTSHSTSSLPPSSYRSDLDLSPAPLHASLSSTPIEGTGSDTYTSRGPHHIGPGQIHTDRGRTRRPPPSAFSLKRTFSFGRRKEKQRSRGPSPSPDEGVTARALAPDVPLLLPAPGDGTVPITPPLGPAIDRPPLHPFLTAPSLPIRKGRPASPSSSLSAISPIPDALLRLPSLPTPMSTPVSATPTLMRPASAASLSSHSSSTTPVRHTARPADTSPLSRKQLTKQRPASVTYELQDFGRHQRGDWIASPSLAACSLSLPLLSPLPSFSPVSTPTRHRPNPSWLSSPQNAPHATARHLSLPGAVDPPRLHPSNLERNPSLSTAASSTSGPSSTEESSSLVTPQDVQDMFGFLSAGVLREGSLDSLVHAPCDNEHPFRQGSRGLPGRPIVDGIPDEGTEEASGCSKASELELPRDLHEPQRLGEDRTRPSSPSYSTTASAVTNATSSSTSTTKATPQRKMTQTEAGRTLRSSDPGDLKLEHPSRRSVAFDTSESTDSLRSGTRPPMIRLRSTSLSAASMTTSSVYSTLSVAEVNVAQEGFVASARRIDLDSALQAAQRMRDPDIASRCSGDGLPNHADATSQTEAERIIERMKASSAAISRAFELEPVTLSSGPPSISLRPPPPPPHLAKRSTSSSYAGSERIVRPSPASPVGQTNGDAPIARRPTIPARTSSLKQLWRRIASTDPPQVDIVQTRSSTSRPRSSTVHVSRNGREEASDVPEVPQPASPLDIKRLIRKASRGKLKPKGNTDEAWRPAVPAVYTKEPATINRTVTARAGLATLARDHKSPTEDQGSHTIDLRLPAFPPLDLPMAATPLQLGSAGPLDMLVEDYFTPKHSSRRPGHLHGIPPESRGQAVICESPLIIESGLFTRHRPLSEANEEMRENARKYRQTLIEIKDDLVFKQVLEDLARLQGGNTPVGTPSVDAATARTRQPDRLASRESEGGVAPRSPHRVSPQDGALMHTPKGVRQPSSKVISERKAREQTIKAWFVTREIVQGERRHGRLMARGVATVRAAAAATALEIPPVPPLPATSSPSSPIASVRRGKSPSRLRRRKQAVSTSEKSSPGPATDNISIRSSALLAPSIRSNPLDILLDRLPRLLAVSLTLSARFEHDPSPLGVAQAFVAMEKELKEEMGAWAGEVGGLVSIGLGGMIDRTPGATPAGSRRGSQSRLHGSDFAGAAGTGGGSTDGQDDEDDPDHRLGFSEIILMPIARALRYKLLFKELLDKIGHDPNEREPISLALLAADGLAIECDRKQVFELDNFRRGSRGSGSAAGATMSGAGGAANVGRQRRHRPSSMGPLSTGSSAARALRVSVS